MKASHFALAISTLSISFALPADAQTTSTISGKLVDIVTYLTKDHNMGTMKSDHAMAGGNNAMAGDDHAMAMAPASCPSLGIILSKGKVILVSAEQGSSTAEVLCSKLNTDVKLTGIAYTQGGTTVFVVSSAN